MEALYEMIQKIACFLLFVSLIEQIIADSKMKKYIHFFSGIILCLFFLNTATSFFGKKTDIKINWDVYDTTEMEKNFKMWEQKSQHMSDTLIEEQKKETERNLEKKAEGIENE